MLYGEMPCPACGSIVKFRENGALDINCYSHKELNITGFWALAHECPNPLCEWSKI
jgi:hypothetical protein